MPGGEFEQALDAHDGAAAGVLPILQASAGAERPPSRPSSARGRPRPPTNRFVQETLNKLNNDSVRSEARFMVDPRWSAQEPLPALGETAISNDVARTPTPTQCGSTGENIVKLPMLQKLMLDDQGGNMLGPLGRTWLVPHLKIEQLRQAFHEEAQACLQSIREEAIEGTRVQIAAQLASWRQADEGMSNLLQTQLKELGDLSQHLRGFIAGVSTRQLQNAKDLAKLEVMKQGLCEDAEGVAERAAEKAATACASDLNALANEYHGQFFKQREFFTLQEQQWYDLHRRLDSMTESLDRVDVRTARTEERIERHEEARLDSDIGYAEALQSIRSQLASLDSKLSETGAEMQKSTADGAQAVQTTILKLFMGEGAAGGEEGGESAPAAAPKTAADDDEAPARPSTVIDLLNVAHDQLNILVSKARKEADELRTVLASEKQRADEGCTTAAELQAKVQELDQGLAKQTAEAEELGARLQELQVVLSDATTAPAAKVLRRIKEIEEKGRVRINRQSGEVDLKQALDFVPVPQNATAATLPEPEFKDNSLASEILNDLADLVKLFDVGVTVEAHAKVIKGKEGLLEKVASMRAEVVSEHLVRAGVGSEVLSAVGCLSKPQAPDAVVVRLDKSIFPDQEHSGAKPQGKAKAAPRRK